MGKKPEGEQDGVRLSIVVLLGMYMLLFVLAQYALRWVECR